MPGSPTMSATRAPSVWADFQSTVSLTNSTVRPAYGNSPATGCNGAGRGDLDAGIGSQGTA